MPEAAKYMKTAQKTNTMAKYHLHLAHLYGDLLNIDPPLALYNQFHLHFYAIIYIKMNGGSLL